MDPMVCARLAKLGWEIDGTKAHKHWNLMRVTPTEDEFFNIFEQQFDGAFFDPFHFEYELDFEKKVGKFDYWVFERDLDIKEVPNMYEVVLPLALTNSLFRPILFGYKTLVEAKYIDFDSEIDNYRLIELTNNFKPAFGFYPQGSKFISSAARDENDSTGYYPIDDDLAYSLIDIYKRDTLMAGLFMRNYIYKFMVEHHDSDWNNEDNKDHNDSLPTNQCKIRRIK